MAFMAANRARNGVPTMQPVDSEQRAQETLIPNVADLGSPQHRTFQPSLSNLKSISALHKVASVDASGFGLSTYESHVPYGPMASSSEGMDADVR